MTQATERTKGRRKFFMDALRSTLVGVFAVTGILLGSRKGPRSPATACPEGLPCRACTAHPTCRKPRAVAARKEIEEPRPGRTSPPPKEEAHD